jgi:hypothetical protein
VPILKPKKDPELSDSYRSISLLPCTLKLLEKILCTRLDYWAEKHNVLSSGQYDFRKGRGTKNCLALLTTDVQTSFETKQQTMAAFSDILGAYDNVLIAILCDILREKEVPLRLQVVRFLFRLLWRKGLVFCAGRLRWCMTLVGH